LPPPRARGPLAHAGARVLAVGGAPAGGSSRLQQQQQTRWQHSEQRVRESFSNCPPAPTFSARPTLRKPTLRKNTCGTNQLPQTRSGPLVPSKPRTLAEIHTPVTPTRPTHLCLAVLAEVRLQRLDVLVKTQGLVGGDFVNSKGDSTQGCQCTVCDSDGVVETQGLVEVRDGTSKGDLSTTQTAHRASRVKRRPLARPHGFCPVSLKRHRSTCSPNTTRVPETATAPATLYSAPGGNRLQTLIHTELKNPTRPPRISLQHAHLHRP
jgi:hypothetical protein